VNIRSECVSVKMFSKGENKLTEWYIHINFDVEIMYGEEITGAVG